MKDRVLKLTRAVNRKIEGRKEPYYKFIVTIPLEHINELGWSEKTQLSMKNDGKRLIIEKD